MYIELMERRGRPDWAGVGRRGGGGEYLGSGRGKYNAGLDQGVLPH